jgi:hypothetical protein
MDLTFTPEEQSFRAEVRDWVRAHLPTHIADKVGQNFGQKRLARLWLAPAIWRPWLERRAKTPV